MSRIYIRRGRSWLLEALFKNATKKLYFKLLDTNLIWTKIRTTDLLTKVALKNVFPDIEITKKKHIKLTYNGGGYFSKS